MFTPHHVSHVRCHMSRVRRQVSPVRCHMSRVTIFSSFFSCQSGGTSRWRVCYQRGLPRLVYLHLTNFIFMNSFSSLSLYTREGKLHIWNPSQILIVMCCFAYPWQHKYWAKIRCPNQSLLFVVTNLTVFFLLVFITKQLEIFFGCHKYLAKQQSQDCHELGYV